MKKLAKSMNTNTFNLIVIGLSTNFILQLTVSQSSLILQPSSSVLEPQIELLFALKTDLKTAKVRLFSSHNIQPQLRKQA